MRESQCRKFASLIFGAACALALGSSAVAETGRDSDAGRISDAILEALVEANGVPGMSATLVRNGDIVWLGSAGLRDIERALPVDADTTFRFASVSKLITATAAARLAQDGGLDLDAPVRSAVRYLPEAWPAISARQLAAHTSGIPHYQEADSERGRVRFNTTADAVGVFSGRTLLSEPGAAYNYSSYGFTLLSAVVEESAGEPFLDYAARVLLHDLDIGPDLGGDSRATIAYDFTGSGGVKPVPSHDYSYSWGGAGFRGSSRDLALFGARVLSSAIVSQATREMMWTPAMLKDGSIVMEDRDAAVGFGWRIGRDLDGARIVHHAGVTDGARSALVLYPESGDSVAVLSNARWTASIEQTAMMLAAPFRVAANSGARCPLTASRFEGRFGDATIRGAARFRLERGVCRGRISAANALGAWLNSFPQRDAAELQIIAVLSDGSLTRAALVTPVGVYDLRATDDGAHAARVGANRALSIAFR
ncbi:MAG: beta-lactamase family protein [Hyphomonadaceae bacterium]|nr:beta-lactamase family protein [Hyphomonadaceae bacterium]